MSHPPSLDKVKDDTGVRHFLGESGSSGRKNVTAGEKTSTLSIALGVDGVFVGYGIHRLATAILGHIRRYIDPEYYLG